MKLPVLPDRKGCNLCPLHQTAKNVGIRGVREYELPPTMADAKLGDDLVARNSLTPGPGVPAVIMVGRNPGRNENDCGLPFVGKPGAILRNGYVAASGLNELATVYYLNTGRCFVVADAEPNWKKHIQPCFPYLVEDIKEILSCHTPLKNNSSGSGGNITTETDLPTTSIRSTMPSKPASKLAVVCLGGVASQAFLALGLGEKKPKSQAEALRNNAREVRWEGHDLFLLHTYHPAFYLRNPNCGIAIEEHMLILVDWLKGNIVAPSQPRIVPVRFPD